ncbi:MAG TPA: hypothetical protein VKX46_03950, partial [Ktedonobacteraceae bacterium]|nr:hypothetical protein [Ktedonobacteraceae bacterium]
MQTSAAIDIGSNTIRVVVAHGSPDTLEVLATDEALVRIGESVNATGQISAQKRTDTLTVLRRHLALAAQYDAAPVLAIATEAIRKATDRDDFIAQIQHETGLTVQIIAGDVEAVLTFYGATYGLHHIPDAPTHVAVMDLGGGSTELVLAEQMHMTWHTSLAIGSGQIHDRFLMNDPPTAEDLSVARTFLDTYFAGLAIKHVPSTLLATG